MYTLIGIDLAEFCFCLYVIQVHCNQIKKQQQRYNVFWPSQFLKNQKHQYLKAICFVPINDHSNVQLFVAYLSAIKAIIFNIFILI